MISFCNRNQPVSGSRIFKTCSKINAETLKNNYVTTYTHWIYWITNLGRFRDQFFLVKSPWNASWVKSSVRYPKYSQVDSPIICWLNPPRILSNIPSVTGCRSLGLHTHILSYYCIILYRILIHIWNISYMYCCHIPTLCSCCINYIPKIPKTRFNTN